MVSTIGPLVQVAKWKWARSAGAFVVASVASAAGLGLLLGVIGSPVSAVVEIPPSVLALIALACALIELRAIPVSVPFCARSVPQSWWRRLGSFYGAIAYGAVLGVGVTTVIPFISFYFVMLVALLAGPLGGSLIVGTYGFGRAFPVVVGSMAISRGLDVEHVAAWAGNRRREAAALCAATLLLVAAVLFAAGALGYST